MEFCQSEKVGTLLSLSALFSGWNTTIICGHIEVIDKTKITSGGWKRIAASLEFSSPVG